MVTIEPKIIIPTACKLGECIIWDSEQGCLWWTDIESATLYRYAMGANTFRKWQLPDRLASFGLTDRKGWFIAAFARGIALYNPEKQNLKWLHQPALEHGVRFNDGRVDRQNRFWCGSMVEIDNHKEDSPLAPKTFGTPKTLETPKALGAPTALGKLYSLDAELHLRIHLVAIRIANSLCWSPDGGRMYFADSPSQTIKQFSTNTEGDLLSSQDFAKTKGEALPDGATVDKEGFIWSAEWGSGKVTRYHPSGKIDWQLSLPCPHITCICFAGLELNYLAVTTANYKLTPEEQARYPTAGHTFIYQLPFTGIDENRFAIAAKGDAFESVQPKVSHHSSKSVES